MVGTRTTSKRITNAARKPPTPKKIVSKKGKQAFNRCSNWIQSQKKEKPKCTVDDLDSDETDEEVDNIRLESASVSKYIVKCSLFLFCLLKFFFIQLQQNVEKAGTITKVYLACEWQRCNLVFETYHELQLHTCAHLKTSHRIGGAFKCEWDLCDFEQSDGVVFKRHVLYHVYMTNLKTTGEQLLDKRPMPPCLNDSRRRNLIPDIESKYVCMWRDCTYTFELAQDYFDHARNHCIYEIDVNKQGNRNTMVQCKW